MVRPSAIWSVRRLSLGPPVPPRPPFRPQIWDRYLHRLAAEGAIQQDAFVKAMQQIASDPIQLSIIEGPLPLFFHCVDSNNDLLIQEDEFVRFFQIIGIDESLAPATFKAIDANNDGDISLEEFIQAGTSFFLSEDESSPSKYFWGPLN